MRMERRGTTGWSEGALTALNSTAAPGPSEEPIEYATDAVLAVCYGMLLVFTAACWIKTWQHRLPTIKKYFWLLIMGNRYVRAQACVAYISCMHLSPFHEGDDVRCA